MVKGWKLTLGVFGGGARLNLKCSFVGEGGVRIWRLEIPWETTKVNQQCHPPSENTRQTIPTLAFEMSPPIQKTTTTRIRKDPNDYSPLCAKENDIYQEKKIPIFYFQQCSLLFSAVQLQYRTVVKKGSKVEMGSKKKDKSTSGVCRSEIERGRERK